MPRKNSKPVVDNIAAYADIKPYDDEKADFFEQDAERPDEGEKPWMYEGGDREISDEDALTDEDLWGEEAKALIPDAAENTADCSVNHDTDICVDSALWFSDIGKRGRMTDMEAHYVGLMMIEFSKFFFTPEQLKNITPEVRKALIEIHRKTEELC